MIAEGGLSLKAILLDPCGARVAQSDGKAVRYLPLKELFPNADGRVPASWFSGVLTIPQGRMVEYIHMGYASRHERSLFITVEKGRVIKREAKPGAKPVDKD